MLHMNNNYGMQEPSKAELVKLEARAAPYKAWMTDTSGISWLDFRAGHKPTGKRPDLDAEFEGRSAIT